MVEIKAFKRKEASDGVGRSFDVEKAIVQAIVSSGGKCIVDTEDVYAFKSEKAFICIANNYTDVREIVDAADGKALLFLNERPTDCAALRPVEAYAYLDAMPVLPKGKYEIKRLAPTLTDTVADAIGMPKCDIELLMRNSGVYGAIAGGKLAGFIGRDDLGGMNIFHVYDRADKGEIAAELTRFLTTLVMTGGRTPFALTADEWRIKMLTDCGFVGGGLHAYTA